MSESSCPACLDPPGVPLHRFTVTQAAQHFVREQSDCRRHRALRDHIRTLWNADECQVIRCPSCGFCYAKPYIAGDATFYGLAFGATNYPTRRWEFEQTRDTLARLVQEGTLREFSLLEIGAGSGAFLKRVVPDLIAPEHVLATEYSDYGVQQVTSLGIACAPTDVRELPETTHAGRFDVVCLFQVLEHMDRIDALFARLRSLTKPAAHLFIAVPSETKIHFNERRGSLMDMPPNHIGRWTPSSFAIIAGRHRWRVVEHRREPERFHSKAIRHLKFVRQRSAQSPHSLANRLERWAPGALRKPAIAASAALAGWSTIPALWELGRRADLGDSQWVWMQKLHPL